MTDLKELIEKHINDVKNNNLSELVTMYLNYGSKYALLKNQVSVTVKMKEEGKEFTMDITEYFKELFNEED